MLFCFVLCDACHKKLSLTPIITVDPKLVMVKDSRVKLIGSKDGRS